MYLVVKTIKKQITDIVGRHEDLDDAIGQFTEIMCSEIEKEDADDIMEALFEMTMGKTYETIYGESELGTIVLKVRNLMIIEELKKEEDKPNKTCFNQKKQSKRYLYK